MAKPHQTPRKGKSGDSEDVFVAGVLDASTWAKNNQTTITFGVIALVVVLVGGWYWVSANRNMENQALVELEQIQQSLSFGDAETAKVSLSQFLEEFGGTVVAHEASLALAELYLETGQPQQAVQTLDRAGIGNRDPLAPQAFTLRGRALESQGQFAEAEAVYLEVADLTEMSFQRVDALADAARMRTELGDTDGALSLYDRILADMSETDPTRGEFEMRAAELRAAQVG